MKKKILFIVLFLIAGLFYNTLSYASGPIFHLAQARDVIKSIKYKQEHNIPLTDIETCIVTNESAFKTGALDGEIFGHPHPSLIFLGVQFFT